MAAKRKKNLIQFLILIVAVIAVVAGSIAFQNWWNSRPGPEPDQVTIKANGQQIKPYMVCEPGVDCPEGEVPQISVGADDTLKIEVPKDIYDHDWSVLKIYDDPAANSQQYFKSHEAKEVEIKGSADGEPRPRLVVVEVSTVLIGHDAAGVETPYTVVWSINAA
ncbi:hypothetical protein CKALI_08755 [Corynebacterium kalinowskii]|uniref:DUF2771 domain-containing protein n=1 Tax=Corynebacterium kalinowskii TaxID=2675216 RepID=A0A6B8VZ56_9CORY|nr:DUF2771 domain-containing protein [Corynebacterium kalinowskii]QGU02610.1 hypothetical protein CKALI_08755 [Corynebacterium kalinowskii]